MRLTLRTLLAYMDGLLDAKDSQEIGKKIEDSKFAAELFHKIRDVMRRLRLAAPSITERGANLDCNTVAEYLDNALPADRVPDFEEVCLKSEMHLAEVGSCHQILTMVLGEPAEIDPDSRQRMYQLPTIANRGDEERLAASEAASKLSGDGNAAAPPVTPLKSRPRPVVPEYLRDPPRKSRLVPAAAAMLLIGAAIGLLLMMLGQFNPHTPLGDAWLWLQAKVHGKTADDNDRDADKRDLDKDLKKLLHEQQSATGPNGQPGPKSNGSGTELPNVDPTATSTVPPGTADPREAPVPAVEKSSEKPLAEKPPAATVGKAPGASGTAVPAEGTTTMAGTLPPASVARTPPGAEAKPGGGEKPLVPPAAGPDLKPGEPKPLPGGITDGAAPVKPPVEVARITPPAVGPASRPPAVEDKTKIGHYLSDGQDVLLTFEANNSRWRRVLPEEFLGGRQPLLSLPSYRPRVAILNIGATLELVNGTRIELLPENAQGQSGVDVDFGRVVIKPLAQAGARLRVVIGSHTGILTLTNVESIAGLEVARTHDPGKDPEKVISHALTKLYVARGGAVWEEGDVKLVRLTAPAELLLDGAASDTPGAGKEVPKWLTVNTVNELDQRAALAVSQALPADHAASRGLMELTVARQKEIRWLASRCLGYLGQFDAMTAALNNVDFRREWPDYVEQLKEAIARGPETAAAIRQSLEQQYGNESAAQLYRMLWGYTDKDLEDGEDARLVKFLDHEVSVFRVLAFENLREITHQGLYYRPESTAAKRQPSVQQWRKQLEAGKIRSRVPEGVPRSAPAEPAKKAVPEPPKPLHEGTSADVRPASAIESIAPTPLAPGPASRPAAAKAAPPGRLSVSVPEPDPAAIRPRIAFPEPRSADRP